VQAPQATSAPETIAEQHISVRKPLLVGALAAALVAAIGFGGLIATWDDRRVDTSCESSAAVTD
jgi:hypothetical protein